MEPPSSVNSDQNLTTGAPVDDPLSKIFTDESYLVVTGLPDEMEGCGYVVCGYSPLTGLSYLGTSSSILKHNQLWHYILKKNSKTKQKSPFGR